MRLVDDRAKARRGKFSGCLPPTSALAIHRDTASKIFPIPPDFTIAADNFVQTAALALTPVLVVPEFLAIQRIHPKNSYTRRTKTEEFSLKEYVVRARLAYRIKERFPFLEKVAWKTYGAIAYRLMASRSENAKEVRKAVRLEYGLLDRSLLPFITLAEDLLPPLFAILLVRGAFGCEKCSIGITQDESRRQGDQGRSLWRRRALFHGFRVLAGFRCFHKPAGRRRCRSRQRGRGVYHAGDLVINLPHSTLVLFHRGCKGFFAAVRGDKLLFLLVALTMVSAFWSDDPALTFRRSVALIGTTLFGVYFARRFSLSDQLRLLSRVFLVATILSIVFVAILPQYGLADPQFGYAWQGIYGHKNNLGSAMALGVVVFIFRAILDRPKSLKWWAATGLALLLLFMAHSSTGLAACLFTLLVFTLSPALRWTLRRAIPFLWECQPLVAAGAGLWAINHLSFVLSFVSRDPSFTGRTTVWIVSIAMITRHPWLGYGYSEFWPGYGSDIVSRLTGVAEMSHAHNAILNLWLDVGLVGGGDIYSAISQVAVARACGRQKYKDD